MSPIFVQNTGETISVQRIVAEINALNLKMEKGYTGLLRYDDGMDRTLVSHQADKSRPAYRWYKFKEAFSSRLVEHVLRDYRMTEGALLDPFAGSGTALFASGALGISAVGIELLPIGHEIIRVRQAVEHGLENDDRVELQRWATTKPWKHCDQQKTIPELRITKGAYPENTVKEIGQYWFLIDQARPLVRSVLQFALLCVLETVSYTRKDGQYLRWDYRAAGRRKASIPFDKGYIPSFEETITAKLNEIIRDLSPETNNPTLFQLNDEVVHGTIRLDGGSCLELLPGFAEESFDCVFTSPPYCNRYDYTRTYALELALLGVDEQHLVELRQKMLSCTVENREKDLLKMNAAWRAVIDYVDKHRFLQLVLRYLETQNEQGLLNNKGIPRMVRGYFYEMACVIYECARVLRSGGIMIMVNDNVQYAGIGIPVDLILSDLACSLGLRVDKILVLPGNKGNSSQQMGLHGRVPQRKCVYVWKKL